ncbi:MAG: hypothetical protein M3142_04515, partial [Bacteroidota bacterium]|nr:hypothetical protein [Bacteroidota bacterium]
MRRILLLVLQLFLFASTLFAQFQNTGIPFINNFNQKNFKTSPLNNAIVQDNRGILFFGNTYGFLEFDGNRWRLVELPNKTIVRSLAKDNKGRIYVGGQNDFGYLQPDALGQMQYVSLKPFIPVKYKEFEDVWKIYPTREGVYFSTSAGFYVYQNGRIQYFPAPEGLGGSLFYVQEQLYMRVPNRGIYEIKNNRAT